MCGGGRVEDRRRRRKRRRSRRNSEEEGTHLGAHSHTNKARAVIKCDIKLMSLGNKREKGNDKR